MTAAITAADIATRLEARYKAEEWLTFHELREGAGFQGNGPAMRTIDFAALHRWESRAHKFVCVEIKVSLADFRNEIARPEKRRVWVEMAQEFWFAAPAKLIAPEELPAECGLLETWGNNLRVKRAAPSRLDARGPDRGTWIMMLRDLDGRLERHRSEVGAFAKFAGRIIGLADLRELADKYASASWRRSELKRELLRELAEERRTENKRAGEWARIAREWEWTLRTIFGSTDPEHAQTARKVLEDVNKIRRAASDVLAALPQFESARRAAP